MFYFKIIGKIYIIYIQLHYNLKLNFSERMKHLRDFLNEGKDTLILTDSEQLRSVTTRLQYWTVALELFPTYDFMIRILCSIILHGTIFVNIF